MGRDSAVSYGEARVRSVWHQPDRQPVQLASSEKLAIAGSRVRSITWTSLWHAKFYCKG